MTTTIHTMSLSDLELLLDWAASEGWNPGLDDAKAFHAADPQGYLMVCQDTQPAACISVVKQGTSHGFLGLYICAPEFRGHGHGWTAWKAGIDYLAGRTIGLDGVVEQQDNYRKSGFDFIYRNIRFTGSTEVLTTGASLKLNPQYKMSACSSRDLPQLLAMDRAVSGIDRECFMRSWLAGDATRHTVVCQHNNSIVGFGTIRECVRQFKIGPVICDDEVIANQLICSLVERVNAQTITLDVPEPHQRAMDLAVTIGLQPVFETARMYRGQAPIIHLNQIFGITTLELG